MDIQIVMVQLFGKLGFYENELASGNEVVRRGIVGQCLERGADGVLMRRPSIHGVPKKTHQK